MELPKKEISVWRFPDGTEAIREKTVGEIKEQNMRRVQEQGKKQKGKK